MNPVLRTTERILVPLLVLFSGWWLLRGHHLPGGGFIAGLVGVAALAFRNLAARGPTRGRRRAGGSGRRPCPSPQQLLGAGLLIASLSAVAAVFAGRPPMSALWMESLGTKLGTPLLFDLGVYVIVLGFGLLILQSVTEPRRR